MLVRCAVGLLVIAACVCAFIGNGYCESKDDLLKQLDQLKAEYYTQKYEIDNKIRTLSREWHDKELAVHEQIQANPEQARQLRQELWQAAKELAQQKKALYNELTPLRKQWYQARMDIEAKLVELDAQAQAAQ